MSVAVIVPWRDTDPYRHVLMEHVTEHYLRELGVHEIALVDADGPTFNRGRALNVGVRRCNADVLVFADADTLVPGDALRAAVELAHEASYVVPFDRLVGLDLEATGLVLRGHDPFVDWRLAHREHVALDWQRRSDGGVNVVTRAAFEQCGGFDPRFVGWGYEDAAFSVAMHALVGAPRWIESEAIHLWHPIDSSRHDDELQSTQLALCRRYEQAAGDADAVRALIAERAA